MVLYRDIASKENDVCIIFEYKISMPFKFQGTQNSTISFIILFYSFPLFLSLIHACIPTYSFSNVYVLKFNFFFQSLFACFYFTFEKKKKNQVVYIIDPPLTISENF